MENAKVGIVILAIYRQLSYCKLMPCTGTISLAFAPRPRPHLIPRFELALKDDKFNHPDRVVKLQNYR